MVFPVTICKDKSSICFFFLIALLSNYVFLLFAFLGHRGDVGTVCKSLCYVHTATLPPGGQCSVIGEGVCQPGVAVQSGLPVTQPPLHRWQHITQSPVPGRYLQPSVQPTRRPTRLPGFCTRAQAVSSVSSSGHRAASLCPDDQLRGCVQLSPLPRQLSDLLSREAFSCVQHWADRTRKRLGE